MSISTTNDSNLDPEARPSTATEEEMQLQIALALSPEECEKAEEMKKSDDARLQLALEESQKQVDCRATSTNPQPSAPNSDPFAAWKNPAALVPSVSLISSNSINLLGGYNNHYLSFYNQLKLFPNQYYCRYYAKYSSQAPLDECSNEIERLAFSLNNNCAVIPSTNMIPMMSSKAKAVVKFTYEPRLEDELCLTKGQYVNVIEKNTDGWWKGEAPNGSVGWFPSNYVEMLNKYEKYTFQRIDDDDDMMSERDSNHGNNSRGRGGCVGYGSDFQRNPDDFIEDDGDSLRRQRERYRGDDNIPERAEEDSRDIFGVEDSNFDEIYDDDGAKIEFEGVKEEIICRRRWRRWRDQKPLKKDLTKKTTLLGFLEPSELVRGFLSAADKEIMIEDAPERFKLRRTPVTKSNEDEIDREAHGTRL
ncbi:unnamed protein product [Caenorhabditis brenneri]